VQQDTGVAAPTESPVRMAEIRNDFGNFRKYRVHARHVGKRVVLAEVVVLWYLMSLPERFFIMRYKSLADGNAVSSRGSTGQ
jgi:hypothetical protein